MIKFFRFVTLSLLWAFACSVVAEDIDVFIGGQAQSGLPNVLFVLDNTSNWSGNDQQFPAMKQGQAEVLAIQQSLANLTNKLNVGVVEFTTDGNAGFDGAYVRFAMQPLTATSQAVLNEKLQQIYNGIETPAEKRNSNTAYGNLMRDVYSYLSGGVQSYSGQGTPSSADSVAYELAYSKFRSPLDSDSLCSKTYVIFIGNPNSSGPADDSVANSNFLRGLYSAVGASPDRLAQDSAGAPLSIPEISTTVVTEEEFQGSSACYAVSNNNLDAAAQSCSAGEALQGRLCYGKSSCACVSSRYTKCSTGKRDYTAKFEVVVTNTTTTITPTGQNDYTSGSAWNLDDWAKFLNNYGVPISYTDSDGETQQQRHLVTTYTIDVYNKRPNAEHTGLLYSAAAVGGGTYYAATNVNEIREAIEDTLSDILSVSSTFAAVTLPLSATNRAQNENQVFIGMFRPDQDAAPRWFGNLKRYQVREFNGSVELADAAGDLAINPQSGFAAECATSYWTIDSGSYWENLGVSPAPRSQCVSNENPWSDAPDGPFVEKGGVAQMLRNSDLSARALLTVSSSSLTPITASNAAELGGDAVYEYLTGSGLGVGELGSTAGGRPSIHGDVIHSRPLPINYGGSAGTVVYYGANDGVLRAVTANSGEERWGLVAPEHFSKIARLYLNEPIVAFPNQDPADNPEPKDYFFDGSIGQVVRYNTSNTVELAYIYPTMRRGGRMVYALNVTNPDSPSLLWRAGCPYLDSDTGCTSGFSGLGQTWSTPRGAYLKGYNNGESPVVVFGGGYDVCEDNTSVDASCSSSSKGSAVYVVDAESGELLGRFDTARPVAADVTLVDVDFDGNADYAYAVDMGGSVWRLSFVDASQSSLPALAEWKWEKVAYTDGEGRKFMNAPSALAYNGKVYLALGSGNRERPLESDYPYAQSVDDRFYAFLDYPAAEGAIDLDDPEVMNDSTTDPGCNVSNIFPDGDKRGWFMDLSGRGEQVVNPAAIAGGDVLFNTYRPGGSQTGLCSNPLGIATGYQMSLFNGSSCGGVRSVEIPGGGMPIAPTISTVRVPGGDGTDGTLETICIGCEGLDPKKIQPTLDNTRSRVYWSSDVDR